MGINFPNTPSVGQLYPSPPITGVPVYEWDGAAWSMQPGGSGGGGPSPATTVPLIESGTGAVGVSLNYARGDHVHPAFGGGGVANPTATIGLTPVNGAAATSLRSDGAPALSQTIVPTWTGKHTYTATAGGIYVSGQPSSAVTLPSPGNFGSAATEYYGELIQLTAAQPTGCELGFGSAISSSVGAGNVNYYKAAAGFEASANVGSAPVWGQTTVVNLASGLGNVTGYCCELDLNNNNQAYTPALAATGIAAANLICTGTHATGAYGTAGVVIANGQSTTDPMWDLGISLGIAGYKNFNTAAIQDVGNSTYTLQVSGTKSTVIDMSNATGNAMFINNNSAILGFNSARSAAVNLVTVDTGNHIAFGDANVAWLSMRQSLIPSTDNTYQLGMSGTRWTTVWAVNGTIQTSDERAKTDIKPLPACLPIVMAVEPKTYRWKDGADDRTHWGLISQELEAAIPKEHDFGGLSRPENPDEMIGLNYAETNAILWQTLRELQAEIEELRSQIMWRVG